MAAFAILASAAPLGQASTPAPGYDQFAGCPSPDENAAITGCLRSVVTGGHFEMGNKKVPISKPMTLTGGVEVELKGFDHNSKGGLVPVKQLVPGGIVGLTGFDWLVNFLHIESLKLYAVTELAGTPEAGIADLSLPVKIHLINPVLGSKCYVGSDTNPVVLNMTTGTTSPPLPNKPISGTFPEIGFDVENSVGTITGGRYVDNSFAAPGASGCTLTLFGFIPVSINGVVNFASDLPAPAGTNETVQTIDTEIVDRNFVYP
jgi:hypothetical protein